MLHVDKYRVSTVFDVKNIRSLLLDEQHFTVIIYESLALVILGENAAQ